MLLRRVLLALAAGSLTLLVAEGALSLLAGRSLLGDRSPTSSGALPSDAWPAAGRDAPSAARPAGDDEDAFQGPYATHDDPLARYTARRDTVVSIAGVPARTDAWGMRRRPGPPPPEDAVRLVVLGDSVAFGWGVADNQTLAARLEQILTASRGPASRPVAAFTVAAPSWNHRNAAAFLLAHWDAYRADVVVYEPVTNDLSDAVAVTSEGKHVLAPDPAEADPWLLVAHSQLIHVERALLERARARGLLPEPLTDGHFGPNALLSDLSAESQRRYDDNARSLVQLHERLATHGSRLAVAFSGLGQYSWHLLDRLLNDHPEVTVLPLERWIPAEHPDARTIAARATWLVQELVQRGWIEGGAGGPLPEVPDDLAALRADPLDALAARQHAEAQRLRAREQLRHVVDTTTVEGIRQVFGGLNLDGTVRTRALLLLRAAGPELLLELGPWAERPDLYPLDVTVEVAGRSLGPVRVPASGPVQVRLPLPAGVEPGGPLEVLLVPERWGVRWDGKRDVLVSFQLLRAACPP